MNMEEIDYWLRSFSNNNQSFMSKDGKKITLFKVFQELKELQYLLKIKNDYINELQQENQKLKKELEEYKLITIDYQELEARNQELKKQIEYLRRSIERKEETITELERERVPYVNEYVENLKKQLEEANEKILLLQASEPMLEYKNALEENQQKEFIEWLTNEANINPYDISDYTYEDIINTILSKYNEIIGSDSK